MQDMEFGGYYPGAVGEIIGLHGRYYHEHWAFDASFETMVGQELSEFVARLDPARDLLLTARCAGRFAGAVVVDSAPASSAACPTETLGARLRWFIVDPAMQGKGLGAELVARALDFCRKAGHETVFLWTFEGLDPARKLYERFGFVLRENHPVDIWGQRINDQKFVLDLA